ncbi:MULTISPECIES: hydrolase [Pseudoalteromonas]|uniref:Enzyme with alpha/beta-hydrolase domain n=2 Tax=Pseudoalteromonas TaxID=53246 RepID=Q3IJT3_PSET1|nr:MULTISPECIES: hydrolase [Pseudoalteromonas]MBB1407317.1 hydrolase [Pseudoalteromonas sp. SG44-5]MBE0421472.1 hydrolase [Pseudoalteromonas nigrifaciens]MBH0071918.1 hydrolase [Pseudoalteromonas sp. NZS127]MBH0094710.1 hydrolase [Pseudoalteromonas sp. SCQQ13]MBO7927822.1 hydrolase [Pseudoalteromonas sp. K222D]|tara:strand:- start:1520 stop:2512 length:993 start_codon:yes stop_codon:yes gene_type:complete
MIHKFKPAWWMTNRHVQTIMPRFFRPFHHTRYQLEQLDTPDGDFIELAWSLPHNETAPLAVVLHGLEGNINSFYAKGMMKALKKQGFAVVLMHFRNCSTEVNRLPRAYHSGDTADLSFFINHLKQLYPNRPLVAVGFSLGGNVLAKYLGEQQQQCPLSAAALVSAPYDLSASSDVIRKSLGKIYQKYLLDRMKKSMQRKLPQIKQQISITTDQLMEIDDLLEFDNQLTAPLHGFENAHDYYRQASAMPYLKHIAVPTLIIHAKDDPMLSIKAVPSRQDVSEHVTLRISEKGGHVGFISGKNPFKPVFWLEQAVPSYFGQYVLNKTNKESV